jgi:hypothetical protein
MNATLLPVDHSALKTNQAVIILLGVLALVAVLMLAGTLLGKPGFGFVYKQVLKPGGLLKPDVVQDNPEPHRFAQGMGAVFMAAGGLLLYAGLPVAGWTLDWIVIALAALNLFGGFCTGCAVYYWLNRLGLPGFSKNSPAGTFPGRRPKVKAWDGK